METDFEGKYLILRDENLQLKKKKNEQEATIKRMYTKLAMIEEALKKKRNGEEGDNQEEPENGGKSVPSRRDLEAEKFILALKNENVLLRKKNQALIEKNRTLEEKVVQFQKKMPSQKANALIASKVAASLRPTSPSAVSPRSTKPQLNNKKTASMTQKDVNAARSLHRQNVSKDLEAALKNRLVIAEKQLVKLQAENAELKRSNGRRDNNEDTEGDDDNNEESGVSSSRLSKIEVDQLQRELRDRQAQLVVLNARYDNLEAKANAERSIQDKTLQQMETMNRTIHKLRSQLQDIQLEKELLESKIAKANELENEIKLLREQNRRLEERMTSLCESPFINDAFQRKERIDKLIDLEKETQQQKMALKQLTEDNQRHVLAINELQTNIRVMKNAKDSVEQELEKVKSKLMEERHAASDAISAAQRMQLTLPRIPGSPTKRQIEQKDACSSPLRSARSAMGIETTKTSASDATKVNPDLLSFPVVARKYEGINLEFLPRPSDENENNSVKYLKNRIHVLQIAHLKTTQELERCEKMLDAQTRINKELASEIEELTNRKVTNMTVLKEKMKDLQLESEERLSRINQLEAQLRQLRYSTDKRDEPEEDEMDSNDENNFDEVASVSESLVAAARELTPGEQLIEIWIVSAVFDTNMVNSSSSTFVLCDFYDFESQSTALLTGSNPVYNFSSTFKVTVDGFFLRYLASDTVTFELHQAVRGDFRVIGTGKIRLSGLLKSKGVIKESLLPIHGVGNKDNILGTLNVVIRLSTPITEIWQLHLQSYPQDIQLLRSDLKKKIIAEEADEEVFASAQRKIDEEEEGIESNENINELEIGVLACKNLHSYGRKQNSKSMSRLPSAYVHYQLLGFPDVFTNIVNESSSPEFDLQCSKQFFTLNVDACLLRFLSKFRLRFTVFDDSSDFQEGAVDHGMIGNCSIPLDELVEGEDIRGWFPLKDQNGQKAGQISLSISWKDPFKIISGRRTRTLTRLGVDPTEASLGGMNSLDVDQLHSLLSKFASKNYDGKVDYGQFLHYAAPSEELESLIVRIKEGLDAAIDSQHMKSISDLLDVEKDIISCEKFEKILSQHGLLLDKQELMLLSKTFGPKAPHDSNEIYTNFVKQHIDPRLPCTERLLKHKVRHTILNFLQKPSQASSTFSSIASPFERFDPGLTRCVTRREFKSCLGAFGFVLLGFEKEYKNLLKGSTSTANPQSSGTNNQEPAQNEEKILDLDEEDITLSIPQTNKDLKKFTKVRAKNEFEQRKAAFIERMNSIATAGNKNVVYEGLEKKSENNRQYFDDQIRIDQVTQQVYKQFQPVGRAHHVAASKLQSSFRRYQTRQKRAATTSFGASSSSPAILEVDECLRSLMKHWTDKEIESLRDNFTMRCESIVDVKKKGHITRKQLSFIFSQISRFVLEPSIMRSLIDYFDQSRGEGAKIDYLALIDFVCSTPAEDFIQNNSILRRLDTLRINNSQLATLLSVADTQHNGLLSLGDFKHCLQQRMEIRLSTGDLRLLVVLFDLNGYEIMYRPLLHLLNQLPSCNTLTNVILRLQRLGTSRIREKIYIHIQSDDGLVSKEQLMQVLTINCEAILDHNETMVLLDVLDTKGSGKISVQEFIRLIESDQTDPSVNTKDTYDIKALQRLASNARKLMCPDHGMLVQAFERFDWKQRGIIPLQEFIHVVRQSGFLVLTTSQIETIAKKFGSKLQGTFGINYREFIEWTSAKQVEMKLVEQKLREFAIKQAEHKVSNEPKAGNFGMLEKVLTEWKKQFTQADVNHSGFITRRQFASVCTQKLNLPIDAEDLRVLLFGYDRQLNDQVDYGAFVQLNFDETAGASTASSKSVKFEEPGSPSKSSQISHELSGSLQKIKKIFKDTPEDLVLENIEKYHAKQRLQENSHGEYLTISSFLLSMKELGVKISSEEVQALFSHFGVKSQNDKDRNQVLDYKTFLVEQLGFSKNLVESYHRRKSSEIKQQESKEDRQRLDELLSSAASFSSSDYSKALHQLKKTAISKGFFEQRLVEKAKVWKTMALSGFEDMLSKKGLSLLIKQFAEEDGDNDEVVSLKLLYKYLRKFRSESPGKSSSPRTTMTLSPSKSPQRIRTTYHNMERIVKGTDTSVVETMRMLAAHWDKEGVDLRGFFEQYDPQYSGHISALHFKTILLQLGIQTFVADAAPEETIGLLVRRYLNNGLKDAIDYVTMLHQILPAYPHLSSDSAVDILEENVRSRFRLNAGFEGRIRMKGFSTYGQLDSAFARLDVEKKGFISIENLKQGLRSMGFNSSPAELNQLMKRMARYYKPEIQSLSRMEFDSFVLDPYGSRLLYKLAQFFFFDSRQEDSRFNVDSEIPRIARLSQVFISKDVNNIGMLPLSVATSSLEQVMAKHLTPVEVSTLQHLFDVQRKEAFAYKLFLKVMSHFGSLHAQNSSSMLTERSFPSKRKIWSNEMNHGGMEQEDNFDKLKKELNSLYAQLSKVDFESSVEIMEEYFRREDQTRKGSISQEQLLSLMNKVGVSISWDTCRVFQKFLGESNSSSDISYQRLLKTLRDLHEDRVSSTNRHGNREQTKRDNHSHNKTGSFLTDLKRQLEKEGINENSLTHAILSQKEKFTLTLPTFLRLLQSLGVKYSTENVVELRNRFSSCDSNASGQFIVNDEAFLQALFR